MELDLSKTHLSDNYVRWLFLLRAGTLTRKDSQISRTFFPKICDQNRWCGLSARPFGKGALNLPSSDIMPGYTASHSACKKTTNLRAKFYGKTALNGEIPVNKYQNNINQMS